MFEKMNPITDQFWTQKIQEHPGFPPPLLKTSLNWPSDAYVFKWLYKTTAK